MTTIFERVSTALATLSPAVPYALGVMITPAGTALPDTYITFTDVTDVPVQHGDNLETQRQYRIQVNIFSRSGLEALPNVTAAMLAAGFTKGPGRQLPYSSDTLHHGLAQDYFYLE